VKYTPHLEVFARVNEIDFRINQTHYQYFLGVYGERLAWDPHKITAEQQEILRMEQLIKAAQSGASNSTEIVVAPALIEDKPMLSVQI